MLIVDEMKAKEADVQANQKMYILALLIDEIGLKGFGRL